MAEIPVQIEERGAALAAMLKITVKLHVRHESYMHKNTARTVTGTAIAMPPPLITTLHRLTCAQVAAIEEERSSRVAREEAITKKLADHEALVAGEFSAHRNGRENALDDLQVRPGIYGRKVAPSAAWCRIDWTRA